MGRLIKKDQSASSNSFISRSQAIKKLQISLADFRRLCILKGIYPREPKNQKRLQKGSSALRTYYYTKDIQHLLHEPILSKLREYKIFAKKISKLIGKREWKAAKDLEQHRPLYTLDHVVKERYPTFFDAVRDLDDALSMIFLFSTLPQTDNITSEIGGKCRQLALEFQTYVIKRRLLRKTFLSIKGIYYQVELMGHPVTWIVPYEFSMLVPVDVDFRVMLTFLEFYETLLGFVNYKFFTDLNLNYPPIVDHSLDDGNGGLNALIFRTVKLSFDKEDGGISEAPEKQRKTKKRHALCAEAAALEPEIASKLSNLEKELSANLEEEEEEQQEDGTEESFPDYCTLFSKLRFFLSREVPRFSLEFVIRCYGGQVGWENGAGSPYQEGDPRITHQIVDRPSLQHIHANRIYLQPQWVYDCINAKCLLSTELYRVGASLPPHLSPFVDQVHDEDGFGERAEAMADSSDEESEAENDAAAKKELALSMMSKKHRKLYDQIQHGKNKKKEEQLKLKQKKKKNADTNNLQTKTAASNNSKKTK